MAIGKLVIVSLPATRNHLNLVFIFAFWFYFILFLSFFSLIKFHNEHLPSN